MAILKIARMGHPVLGRPARPVIYPAAPAIAHLIQDMLDTMIDAPGTGLAAPQVFVPLRVVIFFVSRQRARAEEQAGLSEAEAEAAPETEGADDLEVPLTVLINPVIEVLDATPQVGVEGCLSVPGLMGQVPRARRISYRGITHEGEIIEREAEGFHARVVQHECDHLDGILYPQRMTDMSTLKFSSELGKSYPEGDGLREFS